MTPEHTLPQGHIYESLATTCWDSALTCFFPSLSKEKVSFLPLRSLCQPDALKIGACSQS